MKNETVLMMDTSCIKFGVGATQEVGFEMKELGVNRVMLVTDPYLVNSQAVNTTLQSLHNHDIKVDLFDKVSIEPTDLSFKNAIQFSCNGDYDGYVAVGGGSTMDTAKVANLYATYPAEFLTYVNQPIGKGQPVPGKLPPLIAIPTTAGTGSETTGVAIFDFLDMHAKTGIASRFIRPVMGIVDPFNTLTLPKMVTACTGLDVICHAIESLTALPYNRRPAPENPRMRPAYQGANPISEIWAAKAIELGTKNILTAISEPDNLEARSNMMLAATFAGIGFGNAGVSLPHGMSYPVAGMVRDYFPPDYPTDHPIIPHGMSVILNAPAVFRFTGPANPSKHLYAASLMGADISRAKLEEAGELLATAIIDLMQKTGMPNGLSAVGYKLADVEALVEGTLPQHRVTKLSPKPANAENLMQLFLDSLTIW